MKNNGQKYVKKVAVFLMLLISSLCFSHFLRVHWKNVYTDEISRKVERVENFLVRFAVFLENKHGDIVDLTNIVPYLDSYYLISSEIVGGELLGSEVKVILKNKDKCSYVGIGGIKESGLFECDASQEKLYIHSSTKKLNLNYNLKSNGNLSLGIIGVSMSIDKVQVFHSPFFERIFSHQLTDGQFQQDNLDVDLYKGIYLIITFLVLLVEMGCVFVFFLSSKLTANFVKNKAESSRRAKELSRLRQVQESYKLAKVQLDALENDSRECLDKTKLSLKAGISCLRSLLLELEESYSKERLKLSKRAVDAIEENSNRILSNRYSGEEVCFISLSELLYRCECLCLFDFESKNVTLKIKAMIDSAVELNINKFIIIFSSLLLQGLRNCSPGGLVKADIYLEGGLINVKIKDTGFPYNFSEEKESLFDPRTLSIATINDILEDFGGALKVKVEDNGNIYRFSMNQGEKMAGGDDGNVVKIY